MSSTPLKVIILLMVRHIQLMDFLDKYKYHKDDPREFGVELKDLKKTSNELNNSHLSLAYRFLKVFFYLMRKAKKLLELI